MIFSQCTTVQSLCFCETGRCFLLLTAIGKGVPKGLRLPYPIRCRSRFTVSTEIIWEDSWLISSVIWCPVVLFKSCYLRPVGALLVVDAHNSIDQNQFSGWQPVLKHFNKSCSWTFLMNAAVPVIHAPGLRAPNVVKSRHLHIFSEKKSLLSW